MIAWIEAEYPEYHEKGMVQVTLHSKREIQFAFL